MNYEESGVSILKADLFTGIIKDTVSSDNIGMFAGLYEHPYIPDYYLVGCTDGVGTKIIPLLERNYIETIAIDLVAMNLNDLICTGAAPMFFLDYFATNTLDIELASEFIKSLKSVLSRYNCTLLGGETAELKDIITDNIFDVGGFAAGIVKKDNVLNKESVKNSDIIVGLESSGPHSNGFTLIRNLYRNGLLNNEDMELALKPTNIYVHEILELVRKNLIKVCAHITGGGIAGNLERVIPDGFCAEIEINNIPVQPVFDKLKSVLGFNEAYRAFNMGVGMCIIASEENIDEVISICQPYNPFIPGRITQNKQSKKVIFN